MLTPDDQSLSFHELKSFLTKSSFFKDITQVYYHYHSQQTERGDSTARQQSSQSPEITTQSATSTPTTPASSNANSPKSTQTSIIFKTIENSNSKRRQKMHQEFEALEAKQSTRKDHSTSTVENNVKVSWKVIPILRKKFHIFTFKRIKNFKNHFHDKKFNPIRRFE